MIAAAIVALGQPACSSKSTPALQTGEGLFAEGCPSVGKSTGRAITVDAKFEGPDAVGSKGDWLLMNENVAFVISGPGREITYYHYGGIPVDAVTLEGCTQKSQEKLEEVGIVLATLDIGKFEQSILRAFRGDTAEVINDGSDGQPAHVRVTGYDDYYWLVEYTLIVEARGDGGKPLSQPFGVKTIIDYTLKPGSSVLEIGVTVENETDERIGVFSAALITFGDTLRTHRYTSDEVNFGGFRIDNGVPWLSSADGEAAYAFSIDDADIAHLNIAGIDVFLDLSQSVAKALVTEKRGDRASMKYFLAAGPTDSVSASTHLQSVNPEPIQDRPYVNSAFEGRVVDRAGQPVPGATVDIETDGEGAEWQVLDHMRADADGRFFGTVPDFAIGPFPGWRFRLIARTEGRDPSEPVAVPVPTTGPLLVSVPSEAILEYVIQDDDGEPSPARIDLVRGDGLKRTLFLYGEGKQPLPPGDYEFSATRGFEYEPVQGTLRIASTGSDRMTVILEHSVDTTGFMSVDTHVHSAPSPDSQVDQPVRIKNAAAHGLEIIVATEHEIVASLAPWVESSGLSHVVNTVTGQEVTATIPEHMTLFPIVPDGTPRGGIVPWYRLDIDQLFKAMRNRADGIVIMNHPSYLDEIDWDRVAGAPRLTEPQLLGLRPDAALWSWNFDAVEVMNGFGSPLINGNRRFDNWQSFINHGHRVAAVGCSDTHGLNDIGLPRTYFPSSSDAPAELVVDELVTSFREGRTIVGAGAFARVRAGDKSLGDTVTDTDGTLDLDVHIEAIRGIDVTHFVVLANCQQVARVDATAPDAVVKFDGPVAVPITRDANIVVMAFGTQRLPTGLPQFNPRSTPRFITNPIYVDFDGNGRFDAPGGMDCNYD